MFRYQQLYDTLLNKIKCGDWKSGQKIETERALCDIYNVSRTTARETLRKLEQAGYLIRKQGRGTFVNIKPIEQKLAKLYSLREQFVKEGIAHTIEIIDFSHIQADLIVGQKLNIQVGEIVIKIVRKFYAAKVPYTIETTYLPFKLFPEMTEQQIREDGLYNTFFNFGIIPKRAVEKIRAISMDTEYAQLLETKTKEVAMLIDRVTYSNDKEIEYTINIIKGDFFVYTVNLD